METENETPAQGSKTDVHFLPDRVERQDHEARTILPLEPQHEGWAGLPHGGVIMSMVMELAHRGLATPVLDSGSYPVRASFRWGGPSLLLGDTIEIVVQEQTEAIKGWVIKQGEEQPYLQTTIHRGFSVEKTGISEMDRIAAAIDKSGANSRDKVTALPYSRNCFVCGSEREQPGLHRRFYSTQGDEMPIIFTTMGLDSDDQSRLSWFQLADGQLHPGPLFAVLDEALGWGGFLRTRQGGVTVRLEIDIFRPVESGEKLLTFGACSNVRGKSTQRMFWYSEGGILPMGEEDLSPIMLARGQWLAVPELTEQMPGQLIPPDLAESLFQP